MSPWGIAPHFGVIAPYFGIIAPHGRAIAPHLRIIAPHGPVFAPYVGATAPPTDNMGLIVRMRKEFSLGYSAEARHQCENYMLSNR